MRKKITIILMLALFMLVSAPVSARTFVLSIGIADYDGDEHDLQRSGQDAIKFSDVMKTQTKDVVTLTSRNATRENVIVALAAVCSKAKEGDRIVFFYSGHGADGCVVATDMKPVSYSEMMQLFSASKAKEIVCFFDACFSGTIAQDVRSSDKDIVFFLSSRPDEMSQEDSGWIGAGYLTQALLKGIRGMADTDHNKEVTVMELFKYIYKDVTARVEKRNSNAPDDRYKVRQHPQLVAAKRSYNMVLTKW